MASEVRCTGENIDVLVVAALTAKRAVRIGVMDTEGVRSERRLGTCSTGYGSLPSVWRSSSPYAF